MSNSVFANLERILVTRSDNIGDVVMLSAAIRELRRAYPHAEITLLTSPAGFKISGLIPWLDDVIADRALWQDLSGALPFDPAAQQALIQNIASRRFDAAFIFTSFSQSPYPPAYVCYLAGVPTRAGHSKEFGGAVLSHWFRSPPDEMHQTERSLRLLELCGVQVEDRRLELQIPPAMEGAVDGLLASVGLLSHEPFIALVPGASCAARRYPPARFGEVARRLLRRTEMPLVVLGSEGEALALADAVAPGARSLLGRASVMEYAATLARSSLILANNSSALHIADAFRRPMVITYSGTEHEEQWRPRTAPARLLRRETDCSPCYGFECPYELQCLDIPPEEVAEQAVSLLESQGVTV